MFALFPYGYYPFVKFLIKWISLCKWMNYSFKVIGVLDWFNTILWVFKKVVLNNKSSSLLIFNQNFSYFQKEIRDSWIFPIEFLSSFCTSWAFVSLKNQKKFSYQLFTFLDQVFFVEFNLKIVVFFINFKVDNLRLLILIHPHSKHKTSLSMSLSPFFTFRIV